MQREREGSCRESGRGQLTHTQNRAGPASRRAGRTHGSPVLGCREYRALTAQRRCPGLVGNNGHLCYTCASVWRASEGEDVKRFVDNFPALTETTQRHETDTEIRAFVQGSARKRMEPGAQALTFAPTSWPLTLLQVKRATREE